MTHFEICEHCRWSSKATARFDGRDEFGTWSEGVALPDTLACGLNVRNRSVHPERRVMVICRGQGFKLPDGCPLITEHAVVGSEQAWNSAEWCSDPMSSRSDADYAEKPWMA